MTENPGAPRADELARNAARNALADFTNDWCAERVLAEHAVTWERDVNAAGVPVRRYVLRSQWEVDPEARKVPAAAKPDATADSEIRTGDTVRYRDGRDGGREWLAGRVFTNYRLIAVVSMSTTGQDDVVMHRYAPASHLEVLRRGTASPVRIGTAVLHLPPRDDRTSRDVTFLVDDTQRDHVEGIARRIGATITWESDTTAGPFPLADVTPTEIAEDLGVIDRANARAREVEEGRTNPPVGDL